MRCNRLQQNATDCSTLQHTAPTHCNNTLQHTATGGGCRLAGAACYDHTASRCNTLELTATYCNTLHRTTSATCCNTLQHNATTHRNNALQQADDAGLLKLRAMTTLQHTATHCDTLQLAATYCTTLQQTATHFNTLQHAAAHCNTLQQHMKQHTGKTHCNNTLQQYTTTTHCNRRMMQAHWSCLLRLTGINTKEM